MLQFPVDIPFRITSRYGARIDPITGASSGHNGIDIAMPQGTPILAPQRGLIVSSYYTDTGGHQVIIDHPGNIRTGYAHLSKRQPAGTQVKKGDIVAYSGNTGRSTGPHLHLTVKKNGKQIDPLKIAWQYKKGQNLTPSIPIKKFNTHAFVGIGIGVALTGALIWALSTDRIKL
jgi:murein DD-endopeptidase MepM/ murein hydrolase activator NlpD